MQDLAKSPLVREQNTFEKRLAAAVICQASEDFLLFEESSVRPDKDSRYHAKKRRAVIESAERFFDTRPDEKGERGSRMLQHWMNQLCVRTKPSDPVLNPGLTLKRFHYMTSKKKALYDAELNRRAGAGVLANFPAWIAVEAYRRVVEGGWRYFYAKCADKAGREAKALNRNETILWQNAFRNSLKSTDVEREARDITFEFRNGLIGEAA